jgi:hypothetical protein
MDNKTAYTLGETIAESLKFDKSTRAMVACDVVDALQLVGEKQIHFFRGFHSSQERNKEEPNQ